MPEFNDWCSSIDTIVGAHALRVVSGDPARLNVGVAATAAIVPSHYAAGDQVSRISKRLGKPAAAEFVCGKLPTTKQIRSGERASSEQNSSRPYGKSRRYR